MQPPEKPAIVHQPITPQNAGLKVKKWTKKGIILWSIIGAGVIALAVIAAFVANYLYQLSPVSNDYNKKVTVVIESGSAPSTIANLLEEKQVIRSAFAFNVYTRLHGYRNVLQAGTYILTPSLSTADIVSKLIRGDVSNFTVTLYPGATLVDNSDKPADEKYDVTTALKRAGYSDQEIADALSKQYEGAVFSTKPKTADLEGYIYGETYQFASGASVEDVLNRAFLELEQVIKDNNLVEEYKKKGLTLYEGITLASIIQREVSSGDADQKQVAQIFLDRLSSGMMLGSDVTYQYIADKEGLVRDPTLESAYNTRVHTGLPPGPISAPGKSALLSVAKPASGDYVYFLAGDDKKIYYAHTLAEHEKNIVNHCAVNCSVN